MVKQARAFVMDSNTGDVAKCNSPLLVRGMVQSSEYFSIAKAVTEASVGSRKLRDKYGITLDGVLCATRPFDFYLYAYATTLNTYHCRAGAAKAKDVAGGAWKIIGETSEAIRQQANEFVGKFFGHMAFSDGMQNVWKDYEYLGNGFLEVVPDQQGKPVEGTHIPATEMWVRLDGLGFVQQKNGLYSHFRQYGVDESKFEDLKPNDPLLGPGVTSVVHFLNYFPWSLYYGIPCIMPAWNRMALSVLEVEYNLAFFSNNAVPDYAVVLEGEWGDDSEQKIKDYFQRHLKGKAHKTLVLEIPNGSKITFEKLTSDNAKEGSFRLLRIDCRDEVLHAHGVPPQKVGIVETGKLGGHMSTEQNQEYKQSIVVPGRQKIVTQVNRMLAHRFDTEVLQFQFEPYDTDDVEQNAGVDETYLGSQVLTPNEVRALRFPNLKPLPGGDKTLSKPGQTATDSTITSLQASILKRAKGRVA